jgi:lipopolysaccharide exporter
MALFRLPNFKGNLFATVWTFVAQIVVKLGGSLILTRLLRPEAYGTITVLLSVNYVVTMLGDIAVMFSIVRREGGDQPDYLNTAWTLRLGRSFLNFALVVVCAPLIARAYALPGLTVPIRVFALTFLFSGMESMGYAIAVRRQNSRIIVIAELQAAVLSTIFTVAYCYFSPTFWGLIYGTLLNSLVYSVLSYRYYPEHRPRLHIDREAFKDLLRYSRYSMPSSLLTLALSQFDKIVFLRMFDLQLLGVYSLANNISNTIESLISKISQLILYPRSAHAFRSNRATFALEYYISNARVFASILAVPAAVGGAAQLLISTLYDHRYATAGFVLQAFMVRAALLSLASPAEDMLIGAGEIQVLLVGNIYRAVWTVGGSLLGYYLYGFRGFVYGIALSGLLPLIYYLHLQHRRGYLIGRYELYRVGFVSVVAFLSYVASSELLALTAGRRLHFHI